MIKKCKKCNIEKRIELFPMNRLADHTMCKDTTLHTCKKCRYGVDWNNSTEKEKRDRMKFLLDKYVVKKDGCWEWTAYVNSSGYGTIDINRVKHNAHRVSWMIYKGKIPKGKHVCHICDCRTCTRPEHLFLGSPKENMHDMIKKGRKVSLKGDNCPWAILTEKKVLAILKMFEEGFNSVEIGKKFDIDRRHISDIKRGRRWGHVGDRSKIKQIAPNKIVLNKKKAIEIKKLFKLGSKITDISRKLKVSFSTVSDVVKEKTWKHVKI